MGVTSACLNGEGKVPEERERLKMWVRELRIEWEGGCSNCEGTGSRGHVVRWAMERSLSTSSAHPTSSASSYHGSTSSIYGPCHPFFTFPLSF